MGRAPTVIWASPECKFFSLAYASPRSIAHRNQEEYNPSLDQIEAIFDILTFCKEHYGMPRYWCIENVNGSQGYFLPFYGKPKQKFNGTFLYGEYPPLHIPNKLPTKVEKDTWSSDPLRYNKKSLIPIEMSEAFLDAVHGQTTLSEWI